MAIVIDAKDILDNKKELPTEAFFVDTNIVIDFKDPFGISSTNKKDEERIQLIQSIMHDIRSRLQATPYSTTDTALEYYKHIQNKTVSLYKDINKIDRLSFHDLKKLRKNDHHFRAAWENQMKVFVKTFKRTFPIFGKPILVDNILSDFKFEEMDFGDHLLYKTVNNCESEYRCIFSNDADFYSISDEIFLLTTNPRVIQQAVNDGKLFRS